MKPSDIRDKNIEECAKLQTGLEEELFRLKFKHSVGQLEQTSNMKKVKKDIARVKTILNEKRQVKG